MTFLAALLYLQPFREDLIEVRQRSEPLEVAKLSPLKFPPENKPFAFEWLTEGYGHAWTPTDEYQLRFRVFSQDRKVHDELAPTTARLLLNLWKYNFTELKIDHKPDYNKSCVDVYLCFSGDPGGEQLFDEDSQAKGISTKVNTIYIYDMPSFKEPLEKVREVCHEYGHASLPAVGGYDKPEYWANGYLGENFFMSWLAKQTSINSDLLYGCDPKILRDYVARVCYPMVAKGAMNFPGNSWLAGKSEEHMNRYIGLMLWMQEILPANIVAQSMKLMRSYDPKDVPASIVDACDGIDGLSIKVPSFLVGKKVWLPFGRHTISGAKVLGKSDNWIALYAPKTPIVVR
ncbi:MAG: hypothetical protein JST12_06075 [Armatimonadetes bacterium]|nr:hypothetical protein [Armatimonadota bacterium]